jgi:hypothetical protein
MMTMVARPNMFLSLLVSHGREQAEQRSLRRTGGGDLYRATVGREDRHDGTIEAPQRMSFLGGELTAPGRPHCCVRRSRRVPPHADMKSPRRCSRPEARRGGQTVGRDHPLEQEGAGHRPDGPPRVPQGGHTSKVLSPRRTRSVFSPRTMVSPQRSQARHPQRRSISSVSRTSLPPRVAMLPPVRWLETRRAARCCDLGKLPGAGPVSP